jgi:hypothetical protein
MLSLLLVLQTAQASDPSVLSDRMGTDQSHLPISIRFSPPTHNPLRDGNWDPVFRLLSGDTVRPRLLPTDSFNGSIRISLALPENQGIQILAHRDLAATAVERHLAISYHRNWK